MQPLCHGPLAPTQITDQEKANAAWDALIRGIYRALESGALTEYRLRRGATEEEKEEGGGDGLE